MWNLIIYIVSVNFFRRRFFYENYVWDKLKVFCANGEGKGEFQSVKKGTFACLQQSHINRGAVYHWRRPEVTVPSRPSSRSPIFQSVAQWHNAFVRPSKKVINWGRRIAERVSPLRRWSRSSLARSHWRAAEAGLFHIFAPTSPNIGSHSQLDNRSLRDCH